MLHENHYAGGNNYPRQGLFESALCGECDPIPQSDRRRTYVPPILGVLREVGAKHSEETSETPRLVRVSRCAELNSFQTSCSRTLFRRDPNASTCPTVVRWPFTRMANSLFRKRRRRRGDRNYGWDSRISPRWYRSIIHDCAKLHSFYGSRRT
jgi:hypothetical protein